MSGRDPFARYLEAMAAAGFRPSSTLGQNFLLDPSLHRFVADQAEAGAADTVLEIGVGLGFLTRELASRAGAVLGVEIDARLLAIAKAELQPFANVTLVHADALGGEGRTLHPDVLALLPREPDRLLAVANLPYAASGPLLAELCALDPPPRRAVLLVQKELAARIAAAPGKPDYGGLSAQVQALFSARSVRDVPPQVFRPRPKVTSAVLRLDLRSELPPGLASGAARRRFGVFVRALFGQRRKTLRTTLPAAAAAAGGTVPEGLPDELFGRRAEVLGPGDLAALWLRCAGATGGTAPAGDVPA